MPTKTSPTLGAERALSLVSDQWFIAVMHALMSGRKRYAELRRMIPGVTQKMLTQTLRKMEQDGLVQRTAYPVVPPHTDYALTELGESLIPVLQGLCRWGQANYEQVEANRVRFDEASEQKHNGPSMIDRGAAKR